MNNNQSKASLKRTLYLILTIIFWALFVGLEVVTSRLSDIANAPHKADDVNGVLAPLSGLAFIVAAFSLILAIIFTIAFIRNRKVK